MSDNWIGIIPRDPLFVPKDEAISAAEDLISAFAPDAEEISSEVSGKIQFRDCGANFESVRCPSCHLEIDRGWWFEQMGDEDRWDEGFILHPVELPCGHTVTSLNDLQYDFDQGFSRFILDIMNPGIPMLEPSQVAQIEAILACRVKMIYQHL